METTSRRLASTSSCFAACAWALAVRMRSAVRTSADADSPIAASRARDSRRAARASSSLARACRRRAERAHAALELAHAVARARQLVGGEGSRTPRPPEADERRREPLVETREPRRATRQRRLAQPARRRARLLLALGVQ